MNLKGTKTHDNLKAAFAGESQANRRYLYFASKADVEGQKAKPGTPTAISTICPVSATRRPTCRSAPAG